ncbi:hypothetical protein G6F60_015610 [Rhizopus arrhizus]|nr:hypothetical protein G6F60_015610 [Rhizopus arrhizus]
MADASCGPSAGETTVRPASARIVEMSSVACCEVPEKPRLIPVWWPISRTGSLVYATSMRICSQHSSPRNEAKVATNVIMPVVARPAAADTMFCSEMPNCT